MTKDIENPENLRFYVFMRNDLDSMNTGKACAQSAHAQRNADKLIIRNNAFPDFADTYEAWCAQTDQGFGSTICFEVDGKTLETVCDFFARNTRFPSSKIHDPTYPLLDGKVLHLIPLDTCGWVFGDKDDLFPILKHFNLHP